MTTADWAAHTLLQHPDYRVLRRVPPVADWHWPVQRGDVVRGAVVDTETTGLEESDEVMELAVVPFEYDRSTGCVVGVDADRAFGAFRQPAVPINEEAKRVTGITDEMVAGKTIATETVAAALDGVQLVISHHAGFDRPKLEKHWPELFEPLCWACSFAEVDWRGEGIGSAKLDYLLMRFGAFHDGHRALDDALALLHLLRCALPSGTTVLATLLEQARKPLFSVRVEDAAFKAKAELKSRGYRWNPGSTAVKKCWVKSTGDADAEVAWLKSSSAIGRRTRTITRKLHPKLRYSDRVYTAAAAPPAPREKSS